MTDNNNKKFIAVDGTSEGLDFVQSVCGSIGLRGVGMGIDMLPATVVFTNPLGEEIPACYVISEAVSKGLQMMTASNTALHQATNAVKSNNRVMDVSSVHTIFREAESNSPNNTRLTVLAIETSTVVKQICTATQKWNYLHDLSIGNDSPLAKEIQDRIRSGITFGILIGLQIARKDLKMHLKFLTNSPNEGINKYFGNMKEMQEIHEDPMELGLLLAAYKGA